jgi:6-phosphofructokinase 1
MNPMDAKVAIVTCGGLCPGLNVVIRELVMTLYYNYGTREVYGVKDGYMGFYSENSIVKLTPKDVVDIHNLGGTILRTSRGGWDLQKIANSIDEHQFTQVYIIGGDGTHRGILALVEEFGKRSRAVSFVGVPKTIDNDIPLIDKSFGFDTAVEEAQRAINSADVEANSAAYGIGLVKLMGRNSGFIALHSAIANRDVNLCLIPEAKYELNGDTGIYNYIYERLQMKGHSVIVVAEGASSGCSDETLISAGTDASGNPILYDIGSHIKKGLVSYCKAKGMETTLKYIDPTYMIRTVPAQASDKVLCATLAQAAVHGAFAGFTGFSAGTVGGQACFIPVLTLVNKRQGFEAKPGQSRVDPATSVEWWRLLSSTGQPVFS